MTFWKLLEACQRRSGEFIHYTGPNWVPWVPGKVNNTLSAFIKRRCQAQCGERQKGRWQECLSGISPISITSASLSCPQTCLPCLRNLSQTSNYLDPLLWTAIQWPSLVTALCLLLHLAEPTDSSRHDAEEVWESHLFPVVFGALFKLAI